MMAILLKFDGKNINNLAKHKGEFISKVYQNPALRNSSFYDIFERVSMADNKGRNIWFKFRLKLFKKKYYMNLLKS